MYDMHSYTLHYCTDKEGAVFDVDGDGKQGIYFVWPYARLSLVPWPLFSLVEKREIKQEAVWLGTWAICSFYVQTSWSTKHRRVQTHDFYH